MAPSFWATLRHGRKRKRTRDANVNIEDARTREMLATEIDTDSDGNVNTEDAQTREMIHASTSDGNVNTEDAQTREMEEMLAVTFATDSDVMMESDTETQPPTHEILAKPVATASAKRPKIVNFPQQPPKPNPHQKRYKVEVDTDARLAQGWTADDRHTTSRATRRKNNQDVGAMKLTPQQKRMFGKRKGSKGKGKKQW